MTTSKLSSRRDLGSTRLIGIKEFRQNMTGLLREAQECDIHFIIMRHSEPIAKVAPLTEKEAVLEQLAQEIAEAREDIRQGRYYTSEEVREELGLGKGRRCSSRRKSSRSSRRSRGMRRNYRG